MNLGTQLHAPDGFECLSKNVRYYYLCSDDETKLTTLANFSEQCSGRRVQLHRLQNDRFWSAIDVGRITKYGLAECVNVPAWLWRMEGRNVALEDSKRIKPVLTYIGIAEQRYGYIEALLPQLQEIIRSTSPFALLNRHAKSVKPVQNRQRIAEWFFAYICHGQQLAALTPAYRNTGTYDKSAEKYNATHFGKVSIDKGRLSGWPSAMFSETIRTAVDHFLGMEMTKSEIYKQSLVKYFGCRGRKNARGDWELYHPEGKPFPDTEGKFWYQWYKYCNLRTTNLRHYGEHHVRATSGTKGSYAQTVPAILSELEADGYYLEERPRLLIDEGHGNPLCVVRGVCVATKNVVGVGFANGTEDGDAYRMMLFCAAIGLDEFALLFGLERKDLLDVAVKGLPSHIISDRGSAPIAAIISSLKEKYPVREMTQTYSGQSKPTVEAGHPRTKNVERPANHVTSDKNVIQLIRREICRAAIDNHVRDVGDLITGQRALDGVATTPYALAQYMDSKGLNDAIQVTCDTAVRRFLWEASFELRDGGLWLGSQCYTCPELDASDVYVTLSPGQKILVPGYHLKLNLKWAWVEFRGQLIKLRRKFSVLEGDADAMMTIDDIQKEAEIKRKLAAEHRRSATAAKVEGVTRYEGATGNKWGGTERNPGRARKSSDATIEKSVIGRKYPGAKPRKRAA